MHFKQLKSLFNDSSFKNPEMALSKEKLSSILNPYVKESERSKNSSNVIDKFPQD